eukprot:TRINITY_DN61754_c0_g1_i1.p1 TRINITY_DN61754_c0_g1~~TRINITY_DN61754_c0_g1_i1.p1  ORF type:complete len:680 (-),score=109.81 TRINITY_DN61754_c0_g1_i1:12-1991(-)
MVAFSSISRDSMAAGRRSSHTLLSGRRTLASRCDDASLKLEVAALNALSLRGATREAQTLFWRLERVGRDQSVGWRRTLWNTLLKAFANAGHLEQAETAYTEMVSRGVQPNARTFGKLVEAAAKAGDPQAAGNWFKRQRHFGFEPNVVHYSTVIDAFAKTSDLAGAEQWLAAMATARFGSGDAVALNTVVAAAARRGDQDSAERLTTRMISIRVAPDAWTYSALIGGAARGGNLSAAEKWFARMRDACVLADTAVHNAMINAAAKSKEPAAIATWFACAIEARVAPNERTYNTLITASARRGTLEDAEGWATRMQAEGFAPDRVTFHALLDAAAKRGDSNAAERWFDAMCTACLVPDTETYNVVINAAAEAANPAAAFQWYNRMLGVVPATQSTQSDLYSEAAFGRDTHGMISTINSDATDGIFHDRSPGDISSNSKQSLSAKAPRLALAVVGDIATKANSNIRSVPDVITYNCLMKAFAVAGEMYSAEAWLNRLCQAVPLVPDAASFGTVIQGHAKLAARRPGAERRAEAWFARMEICRVDPTIVQFNQLLGGLSRAVEPRPAAVESIWRRMMDQSIAPSSISAKHVRAALGSDRAACLLSTAAPTSFAANVPLSLADTHSSLRRRRMLSTSVAMVPRRTAMKTATGCITTDRAQWRR